MIGVYGRGFQYGQAFPGLTRCCFCHNLKVPLENPGPGASLRVLIPAFIVGVFLAGCNMSGPGVARVGALPAQGAPLNTTYNSEWVNRGDPDPINSIERKGKLSADLSERELGVRYFDENSEIGDTREPMYLKRQRERQEARQAAWREKMGLKTIRDEQKEREE